MTMKAAVSNRVNMHQRLAGNNFTLTPSLPKGEGAFFFSFWRRKMMKVNNICIIEGLPFSGKVIT